MKRIACCVALLLLVGCSTPAPAPTPPPPPVPVPGAGPALSGLQMLDAKAGWAVSARTVVRTGDGGRRWLDVTPPIGDGTVRSVVLKALSADEAFFIPVLEGVPTVLVYHTVDGGKTWHSAGLPRQGQIRTYGSYLSFSDRLHGWVLVEPEHGMNSSPGELYATGDGGETWALAADQKQVPVVGPIAFRDPRRGWLLGAPASTLPRQLFTTEDGGHTWVPQPVAVDPLPGSLSFDRAPVFFGEQKNEGVLGATFIPDSHHASEYALVLLVTKDGGRTWRGRKPVRTADQAQFVTAKQGWLWSAEPRDTGSAAPVKGALQRSDDDGQTWSAIAPDDTLARVLQAPANVSQIDFVDEQTGWVLLPAPGGGSYLLGTTDGGRTWALLPTVVSKS